MSSMRNFFKPLKEPQFRDPESEFKQTINFVQRVEETARCAIYNPDKSNIIKKEEKKVVTTDHLKSSKVKPKNRTNKNNGRGAKNAIRRPNITPNSQQTHSEPTDCGYKRGIIELPNGSLLHDNKHSSGDFNTNTVSCKITEKVTEIIMDNSVESEISESSKCKKVVKQSKTDRLCLKAVKKKKKEIDVSDDEKSVGEFSLVDILKSDQSSLIKETTSPSNAFQIMMESRKKSIGTNSPGKEVIIENDSNEENIQRYTKAKRKLSLEKLAETKGAKKNIEREETRERLLKKTLDKRKKSFKILLQNGVMKKKLIKNCFKEHSSASNKNKFSCSHDKKTFINEVSAPPYIEGKRKRKGRLHLAGNPSKKSKNCAKENIVTTNDKKKLKVESSDEEFLEKLAPSIRRNGSVLSYFEKLESESSSQPDTVKDNNNIKGDSKIIKVKINKTRKKKTVKNSKVKKKSVKSEMSNEECSEKLFLKLKEIKKQHPEMTSNVLNSANGDLQSPDSEKVNILNAVSIDVSENIRPKRMNCRKPVRYNQESTEVSDSSSGNEGYHIFTPKKNNHKGKNEHADITNLNETSHIDMVSPIKIINILSPATIRCVRSPSRSTLRKPLSVGESNDSNSVEPPMKSVKLAPLFKKNIPKPLVDPELLAAKLKFLQSGMPDSIRKYQEKLPCPVIDFNVFPIISHVRQTPARLDNGFCVWNLPLISPVKNYDDTITVTDDIAFNCRVFNEYRCTKIPFSCPNEEIADIKTYSCKGGLQEIKRKYAAHPVNKMYNRIKHKYNISCTNDTEERTASRVGELEESLSADDVICNKKYSLWTEKYRPTRSTDIIGNMCSINAIKKWLESWKDYNEISKTYKRKRENSDSSNDFVGSDSESRDSARLPNNMIVIVGPRGSGKTSSVYAIANELEMNVLEVNAGSKRTGKRILTELREATQSHKVLTKMNSDKNNFSGLLEKIENAAPVKKKDVPVDAKNEGEMYNFKNMKRSKRSKLKSNKGKGDIFLQKSNSDTQNMSLMLIEDADIVFEEDDGFVNALVQIVQSSKRPVILVASDFKCLHLQRFMLEKNVIHFYPLTGALLGPWLDVLMLIECGKLIPDFSSRLLDFYKGDMRTALLQLQYWLLDTKKNNTLVSKNDNTNSIETVNEEQKLNEKIHETINQKKSEIVACNLKIFLESSYALDLDNTWWNITALFDSVTQDDKENNKTNRVQNESLQSLVNLFDCLSTIDLMKSYSTNNLHNFGMVKHPWQFQLTDSLSESEDLTLYDQFRAFSSTWSGELITLSCKHMVDKFNYTNNHSIHEYFHRERDSRWQYLQTKQAAHNEICQQIPYGSQMDRTALSTDYMATLRTICRAETERSGNNLKRNNRFHHYLKSISFDSSIQVFHETCEILFNNYSSPQS